MCKILNKTILIIFLLLAFVNGFGQSKICSNGNQDTIASKKDVVDTKACAVGESEVKASNDPNEIIGTKGYDAIGETLQWVSATASLPYTIYFENDPELATAAAQKVEIRHRLHAEADISTFAVGTFGFGNHVFTVEGSPSYYQQRLDLTHDMGIFVDVVAGIDIVAGEAFWIFQSIDPSTGIPPQGTQQGFLPVNDENHSGEGYVTFTVKPKTTACTTGDVITADASIVFDINEAIPTNVWHNTIDALPPSTQLTGNEVATNELRLQFDGSDDADGCGIKQYKLYMSDNYGSYRLYNTYLPGTEETFIAEPDHCYRFFCLGEDNVGNIEAIKEEAEYEYGNYDILITVVASPEEGGIVNGGAYYAYGAQATVTAQPNSGFTFDHWSYNGATVSTNSTYTFTTENPRDLVANFIYSSSIDLTQTNCLNQGWNWWSSFITMNTAEDFNMLKDELGSNASIIKSQNSFISYSNEWIGSLQTINNQSMYMIKMNSEQTINITGIPVDLASCPISINYGWNWIGYPSNVSMDINSALANITPKNSDIIKTHNAFATFSSSANRWIGGLSSMTPGLGYMYKSNNEETIELVFPVSSRDGEEPCEAHVAYHWDAPTGEYSDNATLVGVIAINEEEQRDEDLIVGAFVGNHCVGQAKAIYVKTFDRYFVFLTYYGDENDEIVFRLYNEKSRIETIGAENNLIFNANSAIGSIEKPYVINFTEMSVAECATEIKIFPNPVKASDNVTICFKEMDVNNLEILIVNTLGTIVYQGAHETNTIDITAPKIPGIYIVKVMEDNGDMYYGKLIVE